MNSIFGVNARMNELVLAASSFSLREVLFLLCLIFLALLGLVTLCRYLINCLMSAFDKACDRLECRLAQRKKRLAAPAPLHAVPFPAQTTPPVKTGETAKHAVPTTSRKRAFRANRDLKIVSAQDALRRNAESGHASARTE